jgi:hypothetical protein
LDTTSFRAIELAGGQLPVLSQDGGRLHYSCDLTKGITAEAMSDLAKLGSLAIREF